MRDLAKTCVLLVATLTASGCREATPPERPAVVRLTGRAMGTTWKIVLAAPAVPGLHDEIRTHLSELDRQMSHWRDDSVISAFNRAPSDRPFRVPDELATVVRCALEVSRATGGALDVTAAPLVDLWGFGPPGRRAAGDLPTPEDIETARRKVDWKRLSLVETDHGQALLKSTPSVRLDLSSLAKGFAIDEIASILEDRGVRSFLVELGGELRAAGTRPGGGPWRVGLERPDPDLAGAVDSVVELNDEAVATSGDYRNFIDHGGDRLPHVLDPRTGRPVSHGLVAVTVFARSAMRADAWATALMVLGPDAGPRVAKETGLRARFRRSGGGDAESR